MYTKHLAKSKHTMNAAVNYTGLVPAKPQTGSREAFVINGTLADVHEVGLTLGYNLCCHWFQKGS